MLETTLVELRRLVNEGTARLERRPQVAAVARLA